MQAYKVQIHTRITELMLGLETDTGGPSLIDGIWKGENWKAQMWSDKRKMTGAYYIPESEDYMRRYFWDEKQEKIILWRISF